MPTSMPTTRPSWRKFGQWTLGERVAILDRTCWETSHTLQCAPWPWRARWAARGEFSKREATWVMEDTDKDSVLMLQQMYLTSLAYQGLGQLTVPQVGSSFLEHKMDPMEFFDLGHTGLHSMGERTPPLPHQVRRVPLGPGGSEVHDIVNGPSPSPLA